MYDRAAIMQEALTIARCFSGNRETWGQRISRALKLVWWQAKEAARIAMEAAKRAAARAAKWGDKTVAELRAVIDDLENRDFLGREGLADLSDAKTALYAAMDREAEEAAAADLDAKRALIASAGGRFCTVIFTKADGTERAMKVQPAALKFHVKGDAATEAGKKATATRAERHPHLLPVWDADKRAPRSVNLATIREIRVNGATHSFRAA